MLTYSIAIRTLSGGPYYRRLLQSIKQQTVQPREVFVVVPAGYQLPEERLGSETFVKTRKGMVHQRVRGLEEAERMSEADYVLCLDDDVEFGPDFAERSLEIIAATGADILAPRLVEQRQADGKPEPKGNRKIALMQRLTGQRAEDNAMAWRIKVMSTGGYRVNTGVNETTATQSCNGGGVWIRRTLAGEMDYRSELWLDRVKYPLPEDQVLAYKAHLAGRRVVYTPEVVVTHNGTSQSSQKQRAYYICEAMGHNYTIFRHRFVYPQASTRIDALKRRMSGGWYVVSNALFFALLGMAKCDFTALRGFASGRRKAAKYLKSTKHTRKYATSE